MKLRSDFSIVISIAFLIQIRILNLSNVENTYLNFPINVVIVINVFPTKYYFVFTNQQKKHKQVDFYKKCDLYNKKPFNSRAKFYLKFQVTSN